MKDKKWMPFYIGGDLGIFSISSTSSGIDKNKLIQDQGEKVVPYITRTDMNNGVNLFIPENQKAKYKIDKGNVITIGLDTQTVFYQEQSFYTGQNIQVLRHKKLNKYNAFFIIPLLKVQMRKFSWGGNGATLGRLFRTQIMLPSKNGKPDWLFMESYMVNLHHSKKRKYFNYLNKTVHELNLKNIVKLEEKKWGKFLLNNLFDVVIGKNVDGNKINKLSGDVAYITRKDANNGLDGFIKTNTNKLNSIFPVITIGNETASPFVQKYPFFTGTKVNILIPKKKIHENALHFISTSLRKQKSKYNYSYTANSTRLKKQYILLPVDKNNKPDYKYMELYINRLLEKKYSHYRQISYNKNMELTVF